MNFILWWPLSNFFFSTLSKELAVSSSSQQQKLRVCDICGAFLSIYDSDRRLADHFGGKLHLGYLQIREKLTELQVTVLFFLSIAA